ncbi:flagellar biosynthetic protein FliO [Alkaliphilus hydrothermalis]|uniref:Flagellar biogenesis protein FliO n=1 Tax=Alkaliphilus hydrothermalis TaxID=1482730 RepID=A0ABS2NLB3_9FIRM|nr:flagellar biosynthetic protein FliO [Alkaliphilus hydrothermalis]MBM7613671.1 flagellar biogenesis protein FliO [Alkaliphilus hydrothermalis]
MIEQIYGGMMMLVAVGVVCILAYLTTILVTKKSNGLLLKTSTVKVLERTSIGIQATVTIIQIKNKVYLLLNQGKQVTVLDAIDIQEWYKSPQFVPSVEEGTGASMPTPMGYILKKFKDSQLNTSHRKGNGGNTDDKS